MTIARLCLRYDLDLIAHSCRIAAAILFTVCTARFDTLLALTSSRQQQQQQQQNYINHF